MDPYASIAADFRTAPYDHQLREFEVSCDVRNRALFWQMRTGKTKVTIDTAWHNHRRSRIKSVLVFAPNGVHENWARRELPIHAWDDTYHSWAWRTDLKNDPEHWERFDEAVRHDGLSWFCFASATLTRDDVRQAIVRVLKRGDVMLVADESHDYRVPGTKRTQWAMAVARKCRMARILTGTPVENSPLAAFTQFELLKQGALGYRSFENFEDRYAVYEQTRTYDGRNFKKLLEYANLEELRERMAPYSSVVLREDCHDLPDLVFEERKIPLTEQQRQAYRELQMSFLLDLESGMVSVGEQTMKLIKMQQVLSGYVKDEYGVVHDVIPDDQNPRLQAVLDEVNLTGDRCIIWCAFREDMDRVCKKLRGDSHEVLEYHGRTSAANKARARKEFEPGSHGVSHLVGHPESGGSGLDLSSAGKIIWYSHTFNAITRSQADERATAIGGGNVPVVDFSSGLTDSYIHSNVRKKVSIAEALSRGGLKDVLKQGLRAA